jgi:hypothetical protein
MTRVVLGMIIGLIGLLGLIVETSDYLQTGVWSSFGLKLAAGLFGTGVLSAFSGITTKRRTSRAIDTALNMYRNNQLIDACKIGSDAGTSESRTRRIIGKAKRDGLLPKDLDLI